LAAERVREFAPASQYLVPELQRLRLAEVQVSCGAKISLEKLTAGRLLQSLESVGQKLEVGIFQRRTRGHWGTGAGHSWVFPTICLSPRGWGKAQSENRRTREQLGGHSCRWNREAKPALIGSLLWSILLQKERICQISSMGKTVTKVGGRKYV